MFEFTIFRIPVRIEPMFLLTMGLLGYIISGRLPEQMMLIGIALFILLAFVSVLLHELGHALTGRRFTNSPVEIVLSSFGGFARFAAPRFTRKQHFLMVAAGPIMNFILAGVFFLLSIFVVPKMGSDNLLSIFVIGGAFINIIWGIFNLLPVYPLDGGQIMHSFIRNQHTAHKSSLVIALLMIGIGVYRNDIFIIMFFAFMAFQNFQIMKMIGRR